MGEYSFLLIIALVVLLGVAIKMWHELAIAKEMRELVAWSFSSDNHIRDGFPLFAYINNAQIKLSIPDSYRISDDKEWHYAKEIIDFYKDELVQDYFNGRHFLIKSKYVVSGECYFMYALYAYLSDHQCDSKIRNHDMHSETVSCKSYGSWGGPLYDATYELSDFAFVFHKMHYITYLYCKNSNILKNMVPDWNEANIKEILDTKQIQISRI